MPESVYEAARSIPVLDDVGVLVAGGGLAANQNVKASDVPIRDLQRELLGQGVHLGDAGRLAELGLT